MKLTKAIREQILETAIDMSSFRKKFIELYNARAELADEINTRSVGGPDVFAKALKVKSECDKLFASLPPEIWSTPVRLNESTSIRPVFTRPDGTTDSFRLMFNGGISNYPFRLSTSDGSAYRIVMNKTITLTEDEYQRLCSLHTLGADLKREFDKFKDDLMAILESVTTTDKLVAIWPEAAGLLPKREAVTKPQLPALQVTELNNLIGLPVGETK